MARVFQLRTCTCPRSVHMLAGACRLTYLWETRAVSFCVCVVAILVALPLHWQSDLVHQKHPLLIKVLFGLTLQPTRHYSHTVRVTIKQSVVSTEFNFVAHKVRFCILTTSYGNPWNVRRGGLKCWFVLFSKWLQMIWMSLLALRVGLRSLFTLERITSLSIYQSRLHQGARVFSVSACVLECEVCCCWW